MKLFDKIIKHSERVGRGAEREVYALSDDYVLKTVRQNRADLQGNQNKLELRVHQECPDHLRYLLCPITAHFYRNQIPIIIMERRVCLTDLDKRELRKAKNRLQSESRRAGEYKEFQLLEVYYKANGLAGYEEFKQDVIQLCEMFTLSVREFLNVANNWGVKPDGRIQYIDYGGKASRRERQRGR